jgi:hypothetical protein
MAATAAEAEAAEAEAAEAEAAEAVDSATLTQDLTGNTIETQHDQHGMQQREDSLDALKKIEERMSGPCICLEAGPSMQQ